MKKGKLLICATPIGNLKDITLRVLETLKEVDLIAAEDTRHTRKLLSHYDIRTKLTSYHEHNEAAKAKELLHKLTKGSHVALVSDAGTPGLSDPGYCLIKACIENGIDVEVLPGPSAAISALVISGLPTDSFIFQGFLPRKKGERCKILTELALNTKTLIFYESPHRIKAFLEDSLEIFGNRKMALVRELTKKFEEVIRGTISEVLEKIKEKKPLGEMVVVIEGAKKAKKGPRPGEKEIQSKVVNLINQGFTKKEAIQMVSKELELPKRIVYEAVKDISAKCGKLKLR
ncbi:16S rRNA (cytidine(1402)-2'-O)-methyltransferase [Candidatus Oleimmundimicrobium sp.]|uniref:16S rRNA (cytidine(1402)-2'-O)-methyltransferase n=1 Tax=Candidatus Oleimmundimicrobium sp. TaxID=3060597 RepID=UPI002716C225|nr:16S rRNA (cytidine(1402)-2'-O)-methyltransferase [Candidatus Oleimmundimicrobium sp.]MDO8886312.1 16S rRNA (cytidine(1402)-2'-O)-methyltransferase [Candidatus Oleimmundimicrobium sp.]